MGVNTSCSGNETIEGVTENDELTSDTRQMWNVTDAYQRENHVFFALLIGVTALFGLLFNFIFLAAVVRVKSMRTIINVFMSNLAVADILILVVTAPIVWVNYQPSFTIDIINGVLWSFEVASYCSVTVVAVERFLAVFRPIEFSARASKRRAAKLSAGIWVVAVVCGVLVVFQNSSYNYKFFLAIFGCIFYTTNLVITLISYIYIVIKLRCQTVLAPRTHKRHWKVLRMLVVNTAAFLLLNSVQITRLVIVLVLLKSSGQKMINLLWILLDLQHWYGILTVVNSSINPFVYSMTNADYRAAMLQAFPFVVRARRRLRRYLRRRRRQRHRRRQPTVAHPEPRGAEQVEMTAIPNRGHARE